MTSELRTSCFVYTPDHHPLMESVHRETSIDEVAKLVLDHTELIEDFSLLILHDVRIIPPGSPTMTEIYENLNAGPLDTTQARLAELLDEIYKTTDQERLNTRRGAILERMVYQAAGKRRMRRGEEVLLNVKRLRGVGSHEQSPNSYSVDVAACFPYDSAVEFYACKLHARWMLKDNGSDKDLRDFDALGEYFARKGRTSYTAVCCMQTRFDLDFDDVYWASIDPYKDILTYSIDEIPQLISGP